MPRRCELGCEPSDVPLHVFPDPAKYPERFRAWLTIVGAKLQNPYDYEDYRKRKLCDIHFTNKDRNRNHRLNALAVPSVHLPSWIPALRQQETNASFVSESISTRPSSSFTGVTNSPLCRACLGPEETAAHVILECVGVAEQRAKTLGPARSLREACGNPRKLLRFWAELGWLSS